MNKLFLKSLYIFLCSVLGALLFLIIQKSLVFIYFILMNFDYKTFGFGITDNGLNQFGYVLTFVAIFFGGWYGTWLGLHWYKLVYGSGEGKGLIYGLRNHSIRGGFKISDDGAEEGSGNITAVKMESPKTLSDNQPSIISNPEPVSKPFEIEALKATSSDAMPQHENPIIPDDVVEAAVQAVTDPVVEVAEEEEEVQEAQEPQEARQEEVQEAPAKPTKRLKEIKVVAPKKVVAAQEEKTLPPFLEAALREKPETSGKRSWDFDDLAKRNSSSNSTQDQSTAQGDSLGLKYSGESAELDINPEIIEGKSVKSAVASPDGEVTIEYEQYGEHQPLKPNEDIGPFETSAELAEELVEELEKPKRTRAKSTSSKTAVKKTPAKKVVTKKPKAVAKVSRITHKKVANIDGINTDTSSVGFSDKAVATKTRSRKS